MLTDLDLRHSICYWIFDFLTQREHVVITDNYTSSPMVLNIGMPQGCVLGPLLYSLCTHDCIEGYNSNCIIKFANDTT